MKSVLIASIMALLATSVVADNCKKGLKYCGHTLLHLGKYREQIDQALAAAGHGGWDGNNVLFDCLGGSSGAIKFIDGCGGGCSDNGAGKSDSCN